MATMYETIMDLPLFKGVSEEQISAFLEKTNVNFINYKAGDKIISKGDRCSHIKYLIKGETLSRTSNTTDTLKISELKQPGSVFFPDRLFGMDTKFPAEVEAVGDVSILQFSKEQYMTLLQTDEIYLLNFLNYLSLHSQRPVDAIKNLTSGKFECRLAMWVITLTESSSTEITVESNQQDLSELTNIPIEQIKTELSELSKLGLLSYSNDKITIKQRKMFMEYITYKY